MAADRQKLWLEPALREYFRGRKVLVVGADGFLGVNGVHALADLGADVSILTRRNLPRVAGFLGRVFHGDLRSATIRSVVAGQEVVFDFAGVSGAADSNQRSTHLLVEDCQAQLNLLRVCAEQEPRPLIVYCSSRLVYGKPRYLPVNESHALAPQSIYAVNKITAENYLKVFRQTHGLRFVVVRLSNPYGPHQPGDGRSYGIINQFIRRAVEGLPLTIYGDGTQLRDYIYVDDVINILLRCVMDEKCHDETFNLGGGEGIAIRNAAEEIARQATGISVRFEPWPQELRLVETGDYVTDLKKLKTYSKVAPQVSFQLGLSWSLDFYRRDFGQRGPVKMAPGGASTRN